MWINRTRRRTWFVTGGNGSLGREILLQLLRADSGAEIVLLLRGADDAEVAAKVDELSRFLREYGAIPPTCDLRAVRGDVSRRRLGLSRDDYDRLTSRVTHIVHAAASIRLVQSLDEARRTNVGGALEILDFAWRCARLQHIAYVSTAYVCGVGRGVIREDELAHGRAFRNAYEQSKWEAEVLLRARAGSLPLTVFRPSIIVGHSRDGRTCNFSTLYRPLRAIAKGRIRKIPGWPEAPLDLVPVDYVAKAIVALTLDPEKDGATYHLTAGRRAVTARRLIESAVRHCGEPGSARLVRFDGCEEARIRAPELGAFFAYLYGHMEFDDQNARRELEARGITAPDPQEFLPHLFAFCNRTRWGRKLPWEETSCPAAA